VNDNFADRLLEAIEEKGSPVCVGIDPSYERLPDDLRSDSASPDQQLSAIRQFCQTVLEIVAGIVPVVKPQSAYFEVYRGKGVSLYYETVRLAKDMGLVVIGDTKRGDIGSTAEAYAKAHLAGPDTPDALTVNGYLGTDGIDPFCEVAARDGKGVFVLVRTSNQSASQTQDFSDAAGQKFYQHIARQTASLGDNEGLLGQRGFSSLGAVVGATYPQEAAELREIMPRQLFLVPGYGAQGAGAEDCAAAFDSNGAGAIVNASRSVIYAYQREPYGRLGWEEAIEASARDFADDIQKAVLG